MFMATPPQIFTSKLVVGLMAVFTNTLVQMGLNGSIKITIYTVLYVMIMMCVICSLMLWNKQCHV